MLLFRGQETHSRSVAKAFSWRALGSIDTFVLSWIFTGNPGAAGLIASTEVITKTVLYYFHERAWSSFAWGFKPYDEQSLSRAEQEEPASGHF